MNKQKAIDAAERIFWASQFLGQTVKEHTFGDTSFGGEEYELGIAAILDYLHDDCGTIVAYLSD